MKTKDIKKKSKIANFFKWSSSCFALSGGIILASNTNLSKYGFIFLALSSSQMLLASIKMQDKSLIVYSASLFIFVDSFGIYRWLLN